MEKLIAIWKKKKWMIVIPILIAATCIYMAWGASDDESVTIHTSEAAMEEAETQSSEADASETEPGSCEIYIDVGGSVALPGVVKLREGDRIYQAIDAAGGTLSDAETKYMNLAEMCTDGQKIYVPSRAEIAEQEVEGGTSTLFSTGAAGSGAADSTAAQGNGKININTADSSTLQQLNGIGPSMAQRIIDYRTQNGNFSKPEDLINVSGIGEKTLAKMIDDVCV